MTKGLGAGYEPRRYSDCPESVSGHDSGDRYGRCSWCGLKIGSVVPAPRGRGSVGRTKLEDAYSYFYDPDYR